MTDPYALHEPLPSLDAPVLVAMLTGWIDASGAGAAAMQAVESACEARPLLTFDSDAFIDYRARRPTMELRDGVNTRLVWPEILLKVGRDPMGQDVLLLSGPEPDAAWRAFGALVGDLAAQLGVRMAVLLGAYPFATPHTRPSRLSCSSPSPELVADAHLLRNSVDVPAGMGAVLEHDFHARGIPAIGVWAQVPHYLGTMAWSGATVALLEGLARMTGLSIDPTEARAESVVQRQRVDQLIATNEEHREMVRQMEAAYEQLGDPRPDTGTAGAPIPTGDELAAELERFLRHQDEEPGDG